MVSPTALRLTAARHLHQPALRKAVFSTARYAFPRTPAQPQWTTLSKTWTCSRTKTTVASQASEKRFKYPEYLNVYRAGSSKTLFMGFLRVASFVVFPVGCVFAMSFYFSPDHSNWVIIPYVLGAAVPAVAVVLLTGPLVHAIKLRLPPSARSSRDELLRFVEDLPRNAELRIECLRLAPWPTKTEVKFGLMRKYRPSFKEGLSNLEYVPENIGEATKAREGTWGFNIIKNAMGRFMVDNVVQDRSSAPGLWDKIWKQIPERGSEHDPIKTLGKKRIERTPVAMANRPQRTTSLPVRPQAKPSSGNR